MKSNDILRASGLVAQTQALLSLDLLILAAPHTTAKLVAEVDPRNGLPPMLLLPISAYEAMIEFSIKANLAELEALGIDTEDLLSAYKQAGEQIKVHQENKRPLDSGAGA